MPVGKKSIQRASMAGGETSPAEKRFTDESKNGTEINSNYYSCAEIASEYISGAFSDDNITCTGLFAPLVESVRKYGIIQPLLIKKIDDNSYTIISGHKRFFAAKKLGLKTVPAIVLDVTASEASELASELAKYEITTAYSTAYKAAAQASKNDMPDYLL